MNHVREALPLALAKRDEVQRCEAQATMNYEPWRASVGCVHTCGD